MSSNERIRPGDHTLTVESLSRESALNPHIREALQEVTFSLNEEFTWEDISDRQTLSVKVTVTLYVGNDTYTDDDTIQNVEVYGFTETYEKLEPEVKRMTKGLRVKAVEAGHTGRQRTRLTVTVEPQE